MKKLVHGFLNWWKDAPAYKSIWFVPVVMVLYVFALLKNFITGEYTNDNNNT